MKKTRQSRKEFRLPRKQKKSLKTGMWLYPADERGNSLMSRPTKFQKDYDSMKEGVLRNLFDRKKLKEGAKKQAEKIDPEIIIPDEQLREYVNDIFREDLRASAYNAFIKAKNSSLAKSAYYNFVNAYNLYQKGEYSFSNIYCLALDRAENLLREERKGKEVLKSLLLMGYVILDTTGYVLGIPNLTVEKV